MTKTECIVDSAYPDDQGWGRIRIDPETMHILDVTPGDILKITGTKTTVAKVWRSLQPDWGKQKTRIDKYTRLNAGVKLGDKITLEKCTSQKQIEILTITPPENIPKNIITEDILDIASLTTYPVNVGDILPVRLLLMGNELLEFKVTAIFPEDACLINKTTEFEMGSDSETFDVPEKITYEDIGGLKKEILKVREMIELPLCHPELFERMGIGSPKGVLLYGPPGTGKTLLAKAVASEAQAHFISIAGPEIISKYYGESEQKMREVFEEAQEKAPSIIFIDELDSIAPKREDAEGELEHRVVAQLLTEMDGISARGQVIVIGATNRPDAIDPALRRPGRFDREIEIGVPSETDRLEILKIHTRNMPFEGKQHLSDQKDKDKPDNYSDPAYLPYCEKRDKLLEQLAALTKGFVGADLAYLAREAAINTLRRNVDITSLGDEKVPEEILQKLEVSKADFFNALREITPSALREISLETPNVTWSDIGGLSEILTEVRESVEYPLTRKNTFTELGIKPPKGVLLYGPPGTGKTLIAKAVANESGANFIAVKGPQLLSKWVGESEKAVREMFKKARQVAPTVLFFDEIDSLTPARGSGDSSRVTENVLNQILTEMDGIEELNNVIVLAASNRPDIIDSALLRTGRFDRLVYIPAPDLSDRKAVLKVHTRTMPIENSEFDALCDELAGLDDESIETLGEKLSGRAVTFKQVMNSAKRFGQGNPRAGFEIRQALSTAFLKNSVTFKDPVRSGLIDRIASETDNYVGSDLEAICREAAMHALREGHPKVALEDFLFAKEKIHPTMNEHVIKYYDAIRTGFKGGLPKDVQNLVEYQ